MVAVDDGGQQHFLPTYPTLKEQPMTQRIEEASVVWLTQEGYDQLKAELEQLKGPARAEITQRISDARDEGDLKENGGYHAAKDEQGKIEARIRQLEDMLRRAQVGETPKAGGKVEPGMKVSIKFAGDDDVETFLLGSRELLALDASVDIDVYSPQSPLGSAILGKKKGDKATYEAPNGKPVTVEIVAAEPFTG
ncbi:transcription elongation factor GreA [Kribbella sandramycini]